MRVLHVVFCVATSVTRRFAMWFSSCCPHPLWSRGILELLVFTDMCAG